LFYFDLQHFYCNFVAYFLLKRLKHILNALLWTLVSLYFVVVILLHIPAIQSFVGNQVSNRIAQKLGTKVQIGRVDLGFLNRFILDDVLIYDQSSQKMLQVSRMSAKFDILPIAQGNISISSAQLFGLKANLYKKTAWSKPNYQFVLDSLASKDTTRHAPLDLQIKSLIIRHGSIRYNQMDAPYHSKMFDLHHLDVQDISSHIILHRITNDSININIKNLAFNEASGIHVKSLKLKLIADKKTAILSHFLLELPHTQLLSDQIKATYLFDKGKIQIPSLQYEGSLDNSFITLSDLKSVIKGISGFVHPLYINSTFTGTSSMLRINSLNVKASNNNINLQVNGSISDLNAKPRWFANISQLRMSAKGIKFIADNLKERFNMPKEVTRLGDITFRGRIGGCGNNLSTIGIIHTNIGQANIAFGKSGSLFTANLETKQLNLRQLFANNKFGDLETRISVKGEFPSKANRQLSLQANGNISHVFYNGYLYKDIKINGKYQNSILDGFFNIDDPNVKIMAKGQLKPSLNHPFANFHATVKDFCPSALGLTSRWPNTKFNGSIYADFIGRSLSTANGKLDITDFSMKSDKNEYSLNAINIRTGLQKGVRYLSMNSDFGQMDVLGNYSYASLQQSVINLIGSKLPTIPGLPSQHPTHNDYTINAEFNNTEWLNHLLNIPLHIAMPFTLKGRVNDVNHQINLTADIPEFEYAGAKYKNATVRITSPGDTLQAEASITKMMDNGRPFSLSVLSHAIDNHLTANIKFNNHDRLSLKGTIHTETQFYNSPEGKSTARVNIQPSEIIVGDTVWNLKSANILYRKNWLQIEDFAIEHDAQHLYINGVASRNASDSIVTDLKNINVAYILNLVNFHAVDFSGYASGKAIISSVFTTPQAHADITVNDFRFEDGRMGTLTASALYKDGQIDINGITDDEGKGQTHVHGYVSPAKNYIDLAIDAKNTRLEFLKSFCGSFMDQVNAYGTGNLRLYGPLSHIELTGLAVADGTINIKPLNTTYTMKNDTVRLIPDEIVFKQDTIRDRNGNLGFVTGSLYHNHLTHLSYDISVNARNLLSYDTHSLDDMSFCGTAYATGTCRIRGKSGEVTIDVDAVPEKGSEIIYNVASPDAISENQFIHWNNRLNENDSIITPFESLTIQQDSVSKPAIPDIPTDIHLNFLIRCNPNATIKVLMDQASGDYIALNGNGTLRATYYNKGSFDMYGNYVVDHGIYKLTIQNVIKRDFNFDQGGTIAFGGNPYDATLNLKAQYIVNGVSLSDLNIGKSFSNNNIRVNCLMNITGTPSAPKVDFSFDMPTINSDAKQMVYSLINSEEEMNQQVLYLLAIGRFYSQSNNNATVTSGQQSRTSLAMQSILSGTISQQLNNVLSTVINNTNWNFGANISTGDEGFNNAEYEGLLSGRLLNNRLLFNGQFGYRDNANATTSFIGDFDLRYLLYPNGNLSIRVYNQTNDRYFTRNSLTTQGLGLILKKDFNGLKDLFGSSKRKKAKEKANNKRKR
jgi:hypothetical protein